MQLQGRKNLCAQLLRTKQKYAPCPLFLRHFPRYFQNRKNCNYAWYFISFCQECRFLGYKFFDGIKCLMLSYQSIYLHQEVQKNRFACQLFPQMFFTRVTSTRLLYFASTRSVFAQRCVQIFLITSSLSKTFIKSSVRIMKQ